MGARARTALRWLLRLAGLGLVAFVLVTQVRWEDEILLRSGERLLGRAEPVADGGYRFFEGGGTGAARPVGKSEIAVRVYGTREVPVVTYGFPTLAGRLAERIPAVLLALGVLAVLVVLTAWRWRLLQRALGLTMGFGRAVRLTFIGGFFNLAVPGATGGDVVKAYYAVRESGAGTRSVLAVFVDRFVGLFGLVLLAAVVLLLSPAREGYEVPRLVVLSLLGGGLAALAVVVIRPLRRALGLSSLLRRLPFQRILQEIRASARLYRGHPGAVATAFGISLFNHACNAGVAWYLASALGIEGVSLGTAMALVPLANLLSAVPLLPGGWGVGELAFAYFFSNVGVPATEAVGLSVVLRLAVLGVNLPGGLLWIFMRGHPPKESIAAEVEEVAAHIEDP